MPSNQIIIENAPSIPGLRFRHFRGSDDYPAMAAVLTLSDQADKIERQVTVDSIAASYQNLINCDPYQDMIIAEIAGGVVGYARGWWEDQTPTGLLYRINAFLLPAWRRKGIGSAMQAWMEDRMRTIAATHPPEQKKLFHVTAFHYQDGKARLLDKADYHPERYFYNMVRPTLDDIPDFPLPEGVELRPVCPMHYWEIWESFHKDPEDEWGYTEATEEKYQEWLVHLIFSRIGGKSPGTYPAIKRLDMC